MAVLSILASLILFAVGSAIGSFLNVVIMRGQRGESLKGRSHCDGCRKTLSWQELIPLVSFVYQKGRCRNCGTVLSVQYPLVELGTGFIFSAVGSRMFYEVLVQGDIVLFLTACFFLTITAAMIVIIVADFNYHIIPNGAVLFLLILGIIASAVRNESVCVLSSSACVPIYWYGVLVDVAVSIGVATFFFALWYLSKGRAMGFGDVKLVGATSLLLGFPLSLVAFLFAFWLGGLGGIMMLLTRMRGLKSEIAFGPFIILGTVLAYFFGNAFLAMSGFKYLF